MPNVPEHLWSNIIEAPLSPLQNLGGESLSSRRTSSFHLESEMAEHEDS